MVSRQPLKTFSATFVLRYGFEAASRDLFDYLRASIWFRDGLSRPFRPLLCFDLVSRRLLETFSTTFVLRFGLETASRDLFGHFCASIWFRDGLSRPFRRLLSFYLVSSRPLSTFSTTFVLRFGLETASRDLFYDICASIWFGDGFSRPVLPLLCLDLVSRRPLKTFSTTFELLFGFETASQDLFGHFCASIWFRGGFSGPFRLPLCFNLVSRRPL